MSNPGSVYGEALYDLARTESLSQEILQQLQVLDESISLQPEYLKLLSSHNMSKQERCNILEQGFAGKVHPYVLNFMKLLTQKGHIRHFGACCQAYRECYYQDHGILPVTAVTAVPLRPEQLEKLTQKLGELTGKTIALTNQVDTAVLGGIRLDYSGKRLDDTVAHRLASVRTMLQNTVL